MGASSSRPSPHEPIRTSYEIGSPETWQLLVVERGWSTEQFEAWYLEMIERLLPGF